MVVRFITKRPINLDSLANTFNPLWRPKTGFRLKFIGDHLVLFSFNAKEEVDKILAAEPWCFDKHIMVPSRYDNTATTNPADMTNVTFWVQVHDIPLRFSNKEVAEQICSVMGTILQPEKENECDGGSFIRVRVSLNISLPLCRGRRITLDNDEVHWVSFKYERLPNLCYWCGCLTHPDKDCERWIESEGSLRKEDQHFGPWMKAAPFIASRKNFLAVPGFFAKKKGEFSGQTQAENQNHPQQPPLDETWEIPPKQPSKTKERGACQASDSPPDVTPPTPVFSADPVMVPSVQTNKAVVFDELIADIDRDIQCFDKKDPAEISLMGCQVNNPPPLHNGLHFPNSPHPSPQPMEPIQSSQLQDNPNHSSPQHPQHLSNERKWVRLLRPNISPNDELSEISLGKRGTSSNFENSQPLKRLATSMDVLPNGPTQTAAAGRQPRRSR